MGDYNNNPDEPLGQQPSNDDPLNGIDPMAWLESLAIRQGASPQEMLTEADIEVPEIDPDSVVIDEPGYTPYEVFGQDTGKIETQAAEPPPVPAYDPLPVPPATQPEPVLDFDPATGIPDGVDPMAWLESLAKKQGVNDEELMTAANIHIDDIDPDSVVIDEPGYTPSETIRARHQPVEPPPPPEPPTYDYSQAEQEAVQYSEDYGQPAPETGQYDDYGQQAQYDYGQQTYQEEWYPPAETPSQPEPALDFDPTTGMPDGVDPMAWLESLAKKQGVNDEELMTAANIHIDDIDPDSVVIDEPGYTPSETIRARHQPVEPPPPPEPEPEPAGYDFGSDFGQDFQALDFESAPPPPEAISDFGQGFEAAPEPAGYDFGSDFGQDFQALDFESAPPPPEQAGYDFGQGFQNPAYEAPTPAPTPYQQGDPFTGEPAEEAPWGGTDFLSSLGEELEAVPNISVDFGTSLDVPPEDTSWLDTISTEGASPQQAEIDLSFLGQAEAPPVEAAIPATHTPEEVFASIEGMSDEDIMRAQVEGTLTPEQELAWLQRQALSLRAAREDAEEEISLDDLAPAEAVEIPSWLQQSAVIDDTPPLSAAFDDSITVPPAPEDVPDWLRDGSTEATESEFELPEFVVEDAYTEEAALAMPSVAEPSSFGSLNLEDYDPTQDEWASALDEEHERLQASEQAEEPAWQPQIADSLPQFADEPDFLGESQPPTWLADVSEELPPPAIPDDLPDWLRPAAAAVVGEESSGAFDDIGTWLREEQTGGPIITPPEGAYSFDAERASAAPPPPTPPNEFSVWLRQEESTSGGAPVLPTEGESLPFGRTGPLPAWAEQQTPAQPPAAPTPLTAPSVPATPPTQARVVTGPLRTTGILSPVQPTVPTPPPPSAPPATRQAPVASQQPAPPAGTPAIVPANYEAYRVRLEENAQDHTTRLELARELSRGGDLDSSLPQYQTLIENQGELDSVAGDLHGLVVANPQNPVVRRLLGDTYMRQGYLQQALDAYRGALDSL